MKKIIAGILLAAMMVGTLAACSLGTKKTSSDDVPTLVWYVPGDQQPDLAQINEEANKIVEPAIGARIDLRFIDTGAYSQKLDMMMASQEEFSLCFVGYLYNYAKAVEKGGLYDITDLLAETDLESLFPDYCWNAAKYNSRIYGLPNQQIMVSSYCEMVRKDLAEKYNLDVNSIYSLKDLEPFLDEIKKNETGIFPANVHWAQFFNDLRANPTYETITSQVTYDRATGKVFPFYDEKGLYEKAKALHEWYKKGYIRADVATLKDDSDFRAGKYALINNYYLPSVENDVKNTTGHEYICLPNTITNGILKTNSILATCTAVSATCKYPEKAVAFLELINKNKDLYNLICFGIEGKHYEKLDDEYIKVEKSSGYFPNAAWKFGNQFNAYLQEGQERDEWDKTVELNEKATRSGILGLFFDTDEILTELAQVSKVWNKYDVMINRGGIDPDTYWEDMKTDFKKAGIEKVVSLYQKQIDEFLAKK